MAGQMLDSLAEFWPGACELLRGEMSTTSYKTWIETLKVVATTSQSGQPTLVLEAPSAFNRNVLENRYNAVIGNALSQVSSCACGVRLITSDERTFTQLAAPQAAENSIGLNPKYTFDTFVVGNSNSFAHAACLAVAEAPAHSYNPLFLYGGVGLGKTHLLHAIGHYVREQNPDARIIYVTIESFTNEFIRAIRTNANDTFRNRYRNVDVLMIDDVQFIAGKDATQEEFFHTFNALHDAQKQVILSSDKPPRQLDIEDRLRSRFEWGLIADIQAPDLETRIAILARKAQSDGILLDNDVLEFIAMRSENNIRELQGALNRIVAYARVNKRRLDLDLARDALHDLMGDSTRVVSPESIITRVCEQFGVSVDEIKGKNKVRHIADARQIAMYLVRELTDLSLPKIGEIFQRDHTTVLHGWRTISGHSARDSELRSLLCDMQRELSGKNV